VETGVEELVNCAQKWQAGISVHAISQYYIRNQNAT